MKHNASADGSALSAQLSAVDLTAKRTPGLKVFDVFLYPILTNFVVFGVSVAATYLTRHGDQTGGKIGQWFFNRGKAFETFAMKHGMGQKQAEASKMVAFSFVDGSVMAPVVKAFEDKRESIARGIDVAMGTKPADESVYDAEPKQSWGSVLGGRIAALTLVLPTAVVLGKFGTKDNKFLWNKVKDNPGFNSLNDHMFNNPGKALGEIIEKKPALAKFFGKLRIPEISAVGFFEAFYTSLCTAVLYFASRIIAASGQKKRDGHAPGTGSESGDVPLLSTLPPTGKSLDVKPEPVSSPSAEPFPTTIAQEPREPVKTVLAGKSGREVQVEKLQEGHLAAIDADAKQQASLTL